MEILFEYSKGCRKHENQDMVGYNNNYYWVIDGATEVFSNSRLSTYQDVQWVVKVLNEELANSKSGIPIKQFVKEAIERMRDRAASCGYDSQVSDFRKLPTYAICCIQCTTNTLEYLVLGDCSCIVSDSPYNRITDTRIKRFHLLINEVKKKYENNKSEYENAVKEKARWVKQFMNKEDGYWIGNFDPSVVDQAISGTIQLSKDCRILLCSDGFKPSIDEAGLVPYDTADIFEKERLKNILHQQNASEEIYYKKTGIDISDDKSVLLIQP